MADYFSTDKPAQVEMSEEAMRVQFEFLWEAIGRAKRSDNDELARILLVSLANGLEHVVSIVNAITAFHQGKEDVLEDMLKRCEEVPGWMAQNAANLRAAIGPTR